jgi:hypothetical protein
VNLFNHFDGGIVTNMRKASHPQEAWVNQIHVAGGASGSTTMVMVFGR